MDECFGQYGWKEFLTNRKGILTDFDKILEQTSNRPTPVDHGPVVEARIRKWLGEFLPKKYAVTSGFIIPDLYDDKAKLYHYDIIIYNCLESPILWTQDSYDNSEQGKYRAIPAKYVHAVYEVKSRLTKRHVEDALNKLDQTKEFSSQLNANYSCGIIFVDLKESDNYNKSIIKGLYRGTTIFGFTGGMVLRYENDHSSTGLISISNIERNAEPDSNIYERSYTPLAKAIDSLKIYMYEDRSVRTSERGDGIALCSTGKDTYSFSKLYFVSYDEGTVSINLSWSRSNFATFCINLLSSLEGLAFNDEKRPSFGRVFDKLEMKPALPQAETPKLGLPFLIITSPEEGENGEKFTINFEENGVIIIFWEEVKNDGDIEAIFSDDGFKTKHSLLGKQKVIKPVKLTITMQNGSDINENKFRKLLRDEGLEIFYRTVYYPTQGHSELYAIGRKVRIKDSGVEFI